MLSHDLYLFIQCQNEQRQKCVISLRFVDFSQICEKTIRDIKNCKLIQWTVIGKVATGFPATPILAPTLTSSPHLGFEKMNKQKIWFSTFPWELCCELQSSSSKIVPARRNSKLFKSMCIYALNNDFSAPSQSTRTCSLKRLVGLVGSKHRKVNLSQLQGRETDSGV